jgi:hypothetical protein
MLAIILSLTLASGMELIQEPVAILTETTRASLEIKVLSGRANTDEVFWFTADAIARDIKSAETERLIKALEGSPYAERGGALESACHAALIIHRGNQSWLFVYEILWITLGSREMDMLVKLYPDDWRFHLIRGIAHYRTASNYGKLRQSNDDLQYVYEQYGQIYGIDEVMILTRFWQGNLCRRRGDLPQARKLWQEVAAYGEPNPFKAMAENLLTQTQAQ